MSKKRLHRSKRDKVIAGVCSGLAHYFNTDSVLVRIIWLILVLCYGVGVLAYLICWLIMPDS